MWQTYINATTIDEVLALSERGERARIVAGATDLILELERGVRKGIDTLIDVTRIPGLDRITLDEDGVIHLGPMVTHNHCVESKLIRERALRWRARPGRSARRRSATAARWPAT
jgi:CO/xanthine dehydrogenase FAD-binding subunit